MRQMNAVAFLYGTFVGRCLLKAVMKLHADRIVVRFLQSRCSRPLMRWFVWRYGVSVPQEDLTAFHSFRDFFARTRAQCQVDETSTHFISPCDGWLSVFSIDEQSCFAIKHSYYSINDLLQDTTVAENYKDGLCLIFRLEAADYHHYCYIDDGFQGVHHHIPGVLHSVQPIACAAFPVFVLNRRCWSLLASKHFGPVVQCEIGALMIGGILNEKENMHVRKGTEKGHFELAGSTIVLLLEKGQLTLTTKVANALTQSTEVRVKQGQWIGTSPKTSSI